MSANSLSACGLQYQRDPDTRIYTAGDLSVVPCPPPDTLAQAYLRLKSERLLDRVFYEDPPDLMWFLNKYREIPVLACWRKRDQCYEFCGLGWCVLQKLMNGTYTKGEVGMVFFRKVLPPLPADFTRLMLEWAFNELKLDVVYGTTPERNSAAVRHAQRMGFTLFGPVPGYATWRGSPCGCWFGAITVREWREKGDISEWT